MIPSTNTQLVTTLMPLLTAIAGFLAGKGVFGLDSATWLSVLGGIVTLAGTIWAAAATRKTALVKEVATMDEVKEVALDREADPAEVKRLNDATPENVTVK